MSLYNTSYEFCDTNSLHASATNISSLNHDQFYKLCPGQLTYQNGTNVHLGQPRCGDGTNFSFMFSRPPKSQRNQREKVLIELSGGGACWDATTCSMQKLFLSFPSWLDLAVGSSCTSWSAWGGTMLCGRTMGDTDFSEYNSVLVPYCTQDVHLGDEQSTDYGVRHVGAHNLYGTLQWVFDNFPDPSHIFITGCSAGATPFPVVYDIINTHYLANGKDVEINGIADSPVYLTPIYFLQNGIQHWNLDTVMDMIGFDFEAYKDDENFPNAVLDFVLDKSKKSDQWGYVTHNADVVSLLYYSFMIGGTVFGSDFGLGRSSKLGEIKPPNRRLDEDLLLQWWMRMNNSLSLAMNDHDNFNSFVIEGTAHCTFSLNVPIQFTGFEEWASKIVKESDIDLSGSVANDTFSGSFSEANSTLLVPAINNTTLGFSSNYTAESGSSELLSTNLATSKHFSSGWGALALLAWGFWFCN